MKVSQSKLPKEGPKESGSFKRKVSRRLVRGNTKCEEDGEVHKSLSPNISEASKSPIRSTFLDPL